MIQDSVKSKDPMKVGRFGLGFKSVFHMTGNKLKLYYISPSSLLTDFANEFIHFVKYSHFIQ